MLRDLYIPLNFYKMVRFSFVFHTLGLPSRPPLTGAPRGPGRKVPHADNLYIPLNFYKMVRFSFVFHTFGLPSRPPLAGVPRGPGRKVPHGVHFECFWAPGSGCPKECFLSAVWRFLIPKSAKKHSKSTPWGTPSQAPNTTQKALRGALSGPVLWDFSADPPPPKDLFGDIFFD